MKQLNQFYRATYINSFVHKMLFFKLILSIVLILSIKVLSAQKHISVKDAIESANQELWDNFIDKYGIIHDFVGETPTPEDCLLGRPNAVGWWSPIENASFFTGLYLSAACERARKSNKEVDRNKARKLSQGLLKCASVSDVPGFISRGVGSDGKCHYPLGSADQTVPWFFGLYNYLKSDIPTARERRKIEKKMDEVINAIMLNDWKLPCDGNFKGQYRDDLKERRYLEVTCYLFILRAMYELTHEDSWFEQYQKALFEYPNESKKTRAEICASGYLTDTTLFGNLNKQQLWIYVKNQATLVKLAFIEDNETIREYYRRGIVKNINNAIEAIEDYKNFDNNDGKIFGNSNWRVCYPNWFPQKTQGDAAKLSGMGDYEKIGKRKGYERKYMTNPLAAAAIIALGDDGSNRKIVESAICHYDYSKLNLSEFFFAEVAYYALKDKF